jgi:hypothetical protein
VAFVHTLTRLSNYTVGQVDDTRALVHQARETRIRESPRKSGNWLEVRAEDFLRVTSLIEQYVRREAEEKLNSANQQNGENQDGGNDTSDENEEQEQAAGNLFANGGQASKQESNGPEQSTCEDDNDGLYSLFNASKGSGASSHTEQRSRHEAKGGDSNSNRGGGENKETREWKNTAQGRSPTKSAPQTRGTQSSGGGTRPLPQFKAAQGSQSSNKRPNQTSAEEISRSGTRASVSPSRRC